jgi:hypothetical protein
VGGSFEVEKHKSRIPGIKMTQEVVGAGLPVRNYQSVALEARNNTIKRNAVVSELCPFGKCV